MDRSVVVIGGANVDIGGTPFNKLIPSDSNPGTVSLSVGGVGRNIAHNLSLLEVPVTLVTSVGGDYFGAQIIKDCRSAGIRTSHIVIDYDNTTSAYLYINDEEGDMALALSHIKLDLITPEYIDSIGDVINSAEILALDANITQETFIRIKEVCNVPIFVDPVSQSHARKIKGHLDGIDIIKPNRLEAELLTGININTVGDYKRAALELLDQGVRKVFISMGNIGMLAAHDNNVYLISRCNADVVSTTGAGDSAAAAIIWAYTTLKDELNSIENEDDLLITAAKAANSAASMTINSVKTINNDINQTKIMEKLLFSDMKVIKL